MPIWLCKRLQVGRERFEFSTPCMGDGSHSCRLMTGSGVSCRSGCDSGAGLRCDVTAGAVKGHPARWHIRRQNLAPLQERASTITRTKLATRSSVSWFPPSHRVS